MELHCDDDLVLLEEVEFEQEETAITKSSNAKETEEAAERIMSEVEGQKDLDGRKKSIQERLTITDSGVKTANDLKAPFGATVNGYNYALGRLIRLVKPSTPRGKVDEVVFEFTRGKFISQIFTVKSSCMFVMGFNMAKANLGLFLEYGEKCVAKYRHNEAKVTAITLWIGPADVKPMMPSTHPTFGTWLKKKSMSVKNFSEWIKNSIEPLPFCHWEEDIYAGIVIELVLDGGGIAIGAILTLKLLYRKANDIPLANFNKNSYAYLPREDFYVWGNSVGACDLQFLLKKGQSVLIQIFKRNDIATQKRSPLLPGKPNLMVQYTAYIGWVGNVRPSAQIAFPVNTNHLESYLSKCNLSLDNFVSLKQGLVLNSVPPKKKPLIPKKVLPKAMPLVDVVTNFEETQLPESEVPKKRPLVERLGKRGQVTEKNICGNCGKNDERKKNSGPVDNLIRLASIIKSPDDPRVNEILKSQEEVDMAIQITSILSKALSRRFETTQREVQQIKEREASYGYRDLSGSSLHDNRSRSPRKDHRSRSPSMRDYRSRSPVQDHRTLSPVQNYRAKSPVRSYRPRDPRPASPVRAYEIKGPSEDYRNKSSVNRNTNMDRKDNYYVEKSVVHDIDRQANEWLDPRHSAGSFSVSSSQPYSDRNTKNYYDDNTHSYRPSSHDIEKRPVNQDFSSHHHSTNLPRGASSSVEVINPFSYSQYDDGNHGNAQGSSGQQPLRQNDDGYNDMLSWDVKRVDAEFQRLSEQYKKMKEMRERASTNARPIVEGDYRNIDPRQSYEPSRAKSPTIVRQMESEMKSKPAFENPYGTTSHQTEGGYIPSFTF